MNGAESLVHTLLKSGVDTCFANPGTSEMHFVAALDRVPGMRCVLGLFEGVVTGAADGYARMAGKPAATLLHCGPGLANGLANLHNARRAQHADRQHRRRPGDLSPSARCAADRGHRGLGARRLGLGAHRHDAADGRRAMPAAAVQAARTPPGQIATLILPSDTSLGRGRRGRRERAGAAAAARRPGRRCAKSPTILRRGTDADPARRRGGAPRARWRMRTHRRRDRLRADGEGADARIARGGGRVPVDSHALCVDTAVEGAGRHQARHPVSGCASR